MITAAIVLGVIFCLIGLIIGLLAVILIDVLFHHDDFNICFYIAILFGTIGVIGGAFCQPYEISEPILSIEDSAFTNGGFILGSGSIDEKPVFVYYAGTNDEYSLKYVYSRYTSIKECSNVTPHIIKYYNDMRSVDKIEIYVPKGTRINTGYKLDGVK